MAINQDPRNPPVGDDPSRPRAADLDAATADGSATPSESAGLHAGADPRNQELEAEKDRNLRLQAELENLRRRTARELADQHRYAGLPLARDILPVLDNVDRAIGAAQQNGEAGTLLDGFRLVRQQLAAILERHNCREIPAEGEAFDPQFHEAILHQPSTEVAADHVMQVTQRGYQMYDRVVRPSQVIVSSGPPQ